MAWFKREKKPIENPTPAEERRVRTEGMWTKCNACRAIIWKKDLEANWEVCPKCEHHFRLSSHAAAWNCCSTKSRGLELDADLASSDPLQFTDTKPYAQRLKEAQRKLGMKDAIITAEGRLNGRPVVCCAMEFGFIGGSMGAVVGEKVARAIERATRSKGTAHRGLLLRRRAHDGRHRQPDATCESFRGAGRLDEAKLPFISMLTDPTTGGVTASYAMLGDLNIAEPGALIGFAGPRVIEQTIRQKLPEGFQTAEFLLEHGFLDAVVPRKELKPYIAQALDFFRELAPMTYEESVRALFSLGRELASPQQARVQKFGLENITDPLPKLWAIRSAPHPACTSPEPTAKVRPPRCSNRSCAPPGLRTGLYTSPHLESINERIRIDGEEYFRRRFRRGLVPRSRLHRIADGLRKARRASHFLRMRHRHGLLAFAEQHRGFRHLRSRPRRPPRRHQYRRYPKSRSSRRSISITKIFSAIPSKKSPAKKPASSSRARGWSAPANAWKLAQ